MAALGLLPLHLKHSVWGRVEIHRKKAGTAIQLHASLTNADIFVGFVCCAHVSALILCEHLQQGLKGNSIIFKKPFISSADITQDVCFVRSVWPKQALKAATCGQKAALVLPKLPLASFYQALNCCTLTSEVSRSGWRIMLGTVENLWQDRV